MSDLPNEPQVGISDGGLAEHVIRAILTKYNIGPFSQSYVQVSGPNREKDWDALVSIATQAVRDVRSY